MSENSFPPAGEFCTADILKGYGNRNGFYQNNVQAESVDMAFCLYVR